MSDTPTPKPKPTPTPTPKPTPTRHRGWRRLRVLVVMAGVIYYLYTCFDKKTAGIANIMSSHIH